MTLFGWIWPGNVTDWGTVLGAIATAAAVVVALYVAGRDGRRARRADVWSQASKVSAWHADLLLGPRGHERTEKVVVILNESGAPIWDVCVSAGGQHGAASAWYEGNELNNCVTIIPPGRYRIPAPAGFDEGASPGMNTRLDAAISFRDADGAFWRRDAAGHLARTKRNPFAELKIERPNAWVQSVLLSDVRIIRAEDPIPVARLGE